MSAKLGSHGGKDIAKIMAITNGSGKGGSYHWIRSLSNTQFKHIARKSIATYPNFNNSYDKIYQ